MFRTLQQQQQKRHYMFMNSETGTVKKTVKKHFLCLSQDEIYTEGHVLMVLWLEIFSFLVKDNLVKATRVYFEWWSMIMRGAYFKEVE